LMKSRRMLIVIDESPEFLKLESARDEIMRAVNQWRMLGIYIMFAAQKATMLPDWILTQSRYVFCAHNIDTESMIAILKAKQKYDFHPSFHRDVSDMIRGFKIKPTGEREWYSIDDQAQGKRETIFFNYMPLSEHMEE
jgi:hypothetical protein